MAGLSANNFSVSTPSGYTPIGVATFSAGIAGAYVYQINAQATGTARMMSLMNIKSASITATPSIAILYAKSAVVN